MEDEDYAAKYGHSYEKKGKWRRMAKQSIDARFVDGKSGLHVGAVARGHPFYVGGEIGLFRYFTSYLSGRISFAGLASESDAHWSKGADVGLRVQSPSRISPYAGVGAFAGSWEEKVSAPSGFGTIKKSGGIGAVYPEVGAHVWLNGEMRLTAGARYYVTSGDRRNDAWVYGLSLAFLIGPTEPRGEPSPPVVLSPEELRDWVENGPSGGAGPHLPGVLLQLEDEEHDPSDEGRAGNDNEANVDVGGGAGIRASW
jgi:hypothetical protein